MHAPNDMHAFVMSSLGIEIESFLACSVGETCIDGPNGAVQLLTPMEGGMSILFYVETQNGSASGAG